MTIYVWMTEAPDGPSIVGMIIDGMHTPLVSVRERFARGSLREVAESHRTATGQRTWLRRYEGHVDEEPLP